MKLMKRFFSLLVILVMLMTTVALAANDVSFSFGDAVTLKPAESTTISVTFKKAGNVTYELKQYKSENIAYTETKTVTANSTVKFTVPYDKTDLTRENPTKCMVATITIGGTKYEQRLHYTLNSDDTIMVEKPTWYSNNTACSFGLSFREVTPELTSKWYTFTPVDLSIQGRQEFDYIAANLYIIGKVYVDVAGDSVTVSYHNYYTQQGGNTETTAEYFNIFHNLSEATTNAIESLPVSGFVFNQPFSIERDLGGDHQVLLYVCNHVTYCDYVLYYHKLTRYWPNLPERVAYREAMTQMMNAWEK